MGTIVAFGNPLLDFIVHLKNEELDLLNKYNLEKDGQKEISESQMKNLLEDLSQHEKVIAPGGCAQNTLRTLQWVLAKKDMLATIIGSVGKDANGKLLKKLLKRDRVFAKYIEHYEHSTGTTVALVNGSNRSLVATLGAAEILATSRLRISVPDIEEQLRMADLVYMEGFFLTKREEVSKFILDTCNRIQKPLVFNLSAQYLVDEFPNLILHFTENCDILFGNKREFEALLPLYEELSIEYLAQDLQQTKRGKIVIITDGPKTIRVVHNNAIIERFDVPVMKPEDICDTTGAGDAFVGGFLAGIFRMQNVIECCKLGCFAAQEIIKRSGCTIPDNPANV